MKRWSDSMPQSMGTVAEFQARRRPFLLIAAETSWSMPEKYCLSMSFTHSPALRVTTKVFAGLELRKVELRAVADDAVVGLGADDRALDVGDIDVALATVAVQEVLAIVVLPVAAEPHA